MGQGEDVYDEISVSIGGSIYQLLKFIFGMGVI
jgi:hypothetical protein